MGCNGKCRSSVTDGEKLSVPGAGDDTESDDECTCACDCSAGTSIQEAQSEIAALNGIESRLFEIGGAIDAVFPGWQNNGKALPANVQLLLTGGSGMISLDDVTGGRMTLENVDDVVPIRDPLPGTSTIESNDVTADGAITGGETVGTPAFAPTYSVSTTVGTPCTPVLIPTAETCAIEVWQGKIFDIPDACHLWIQVRHCWGGPIKRYEVWHDADAKTRDGKDAGKKLGADKKNSHVYRDISNPATGDPKTDKENPPWTNSYSRVCSIEINCNSGDGCDVKTPCCDLINDEWVGSYKHATDYQFTHGNNSNTFAVSFLQAVFLCSPEKIKECLEAIPDCALEHGGSLASPQFFDRLIKDTTKTIRGK